MDGETALVFARSRAYADGDFTRTANQRKLIAALAEKILSMPLAKLPGIVQTAAGSITTDMSVTDLYSLATQFQDGGELTMTSCMVPSITGMYKSASYVFCDENALGLDDADHRGGRRRERDHGGNEQARPATWCEIEAGCSRGGRTCGVRCAGAKPRRIRSCWIAHAKGRSCSPYWNQPAHIRLNRAVVFSCATMCQKLYELDRKAILYALRLCRGKPRPMPYRHRRGRACGLRVSESQINSDLGSPPIGLRARRQAVHRA